MEHIPSPFVQTVSELSQLLSQTKNVELNGEPGQPFILLPTTAKVEDLERFMPRPLDKRGTIQLGERESFTRYVNEHKTPATRLCHMAGGFTAVIDFHESGTDGKGSWMRHKVVFGLRTSPQWDLWMAKNKQRLNQKAFAEFLEDNYPDITDPAGAAVLDVANTLEVVSTALFRSAQRLDNSTNQLHYETNHTTKAGQKGDLNVPRVFTLEIPIFYGEPAIKLQARLKYSLDDGKVTFWYELVRPQQAVDASVDAMAKEIEAATGLKPYVGKLA